MNNNFEFWCELNQVEKAVDEKTGEEIMLLGGIASTADEDSDGEFLDPKGFDIKPLLKSGLVNWHHQAKTNPGTIVGEPTKAEIRKEGLYIETQLYPHSQVACDIWELAKTLAKDSKTRRLGYSIEGRVVQRKSDDPTNPDYKKIIKAVITGVAITHQPKNPKTFANIIKGDIDDDLDNEEEKEEIKEKEVTTDTEEAMDTETGAALKRESVDDSLKVTTFGKSEVYDKIFQDIPGISISKAEKIYSLIEKIAMKKDSKAITADDIQKAYDALGLEVPVLDIAKGEDEEDEKVNESDEDSEDEEEAEDDNKGVEKADDSDEEFEDDDEDSEDNEDDEEAEDDSEDEDDEDEEEKKPIKKARTNSIGLKFERIEKAIALSHNSQSKYIKALGVIIKAQSMQLEKAQNTIDEAVDKIELQDSIIKGYEEQFNAINEQLAEIGNSVPAPKSIRNARPVERAFGKAQENGIEKGEQAGRLGKNQVSIKNRAAIAEILDQATFAKGGYDEEFSKACTAYEAGAELPTSILSRIKAEFGIDIVRD